MAKAHHLSPPETANHKINRSFQLCYGDLMGRLTLVAIGGYKYVNKITDKYTKWTAVYLITNNKDLQSLQLFVGSTAIPFGGCIVRWCADKGGGYTGEEFPSFVGTPYICLRRRTKLFSPFYSSSARRPFHSAAASFVGVPIRAASTPGRSFGRPVLSKSSPLQYTAANRCVRPRRENPVHHGSVHDCRQRFFIVHVRGAVHGGCVPQKQDFA